MLAPIALGWLFSAGLVANLVGLAALLGTLPWLDRFAAELPGEEHEWRFASEDGRTGAKIRQEIGRLVVRWTGDESARFESELAFGELIANAVRYAPGPARVAVSCDAEGNTTLVVEDSGAGFTPREAGTDPFAESGRGLALVRAIVDEVRIEPTSLGGTRGCWVGRSR